jgi:hypothetical protein
MYQQEAFLRKARESLIFAKRAATPHDRKLFLEIAHAWRGTAHPTKTDSGLRRSHRKGRKAQASPPKP